MKLILKKILQRGYLILNNKHIRKKASAKNLVKTAEFIIIKIIKFFIIPLILPY